MVPISSGLSMIGLELVLLVRSNSLIVGCLDLVVAFLAAEAAQADGEADHAKIAGAGGEGEVRATALELRVWEVASEPGVIQPVIHSSLVMLLLAGELVVECIQR